MNQTERSKVVIVPCESYDEELVYRRLRCGIGMLGGIERFATPSEPLLIKPNFLTPSEQEKAITTHPSVLKAMFRILSEHGFSKVTVGDSPGHGSNENALKKLGLGDAMAQYGVTPADMEHEVSYDYPDGLTAKHFYFTKAISDADAIICICKMKTHALEKITGAVKNVYGYICGYRKAAGHVSYPNASIFARFLCDIHRCKPARLHIMDAVIAMEGNGPGSGDPTPMKLLLLSTDPVAIDTVFAKLVHLDPDLVPTITQGVAMGIGRAAADEIELLLAEDEAKLRSAEDEAELQSAEDEAKSALILSMDELVERFGNPDFNVDRTGKKHTLLSRWSDFMTEFARRPVIEAADCIRCGICVSHCPVPGKAVDFKKGRDHAPVYDYKKCIRCYCCQEMCPQHAIHVKGQKKRT